MVLCTELCCWLYRAPRGAARTYAGAFRCVCVDGAACRAFWTDLGGEIECSVARGQRLGVGWWVCHRWPSECYICAYDSWERRPVGLG